MIFDTVTLFPYGVNCYLIGDAAAGSCAVIDPGADPDKVLELIRKSGLRLEKIFLTHGHYDHVGAAAAVAQAFPGAEVLLHPADAREKADARLFPPLAQASAPLAEGQTLAVGGVAIQVLHTPGHSAGSVTLLAEDVMLCGDTLFAGSCGRFDFADGSQEALLASLARLGQLERDYKVCPGHGPLSTLEVERRTNPCLRQALAL